MYLQAKPCKAIWKKGVERYEAVVGHARRAVLIAPGYPAALAAFIGKCTRGPAECVQCSAGILQASVRK